MTVSKTIVPNVKTIEMALIWPSIHPVLKEVTHVRIQLTDIGPRSGVLNHDLDIYISESIQLDRK